MQEVYMVILGVIAVIALAVSAVSLLRMKRLKDRLDSLLAGMESGSNLEETIGQYFAGVQSVESQLEVIKKNYKHLTDIATASIQKTAIVRFNPFQNTGSDQSFVLGLLDNHDNGLLLTSIHSREGTRVYIKPVRYGNSEHTLSQEEQQALLAAQTNKKED